MIYLHTLLFSVVVLILGIAFFTKDPQTKNNKLLDIITGTIVTCFGCFIASFITNKLDEESRKNRLIDYLTLTQEYYYNYLHTKNISSSVSNMMLTLKKLTNEPIESRDSIRYGFLVLPDLYERFIVDESIYVLLSDEMKNDIVRFREQNQIYKLEFDNIKTLDEKVSFLSQLIFKFDEQIETLKIEKSFQLGKLNKEEFLSKRRIMLQDQTKQPY